MKVYYITFGCKVNLCETEALKSEFASAGFEATQDETIADIYIVNSCTVTAVSDKKVRQTLNRLKTEYPNSTIVLTGCYPQAFKEQAERISTVDVVTGTKDRKKIVDLVKQYLDTNNRMVSINEYTNSDTFESIPMGTFDNKTRGFVKVQDGCNRFCTYCIIPYARGRIRSKPLADVEAEVKSLVSYGHKEIVLVGINLMFYGVEFGKRLVDVVEVCSKVEGVERIRLGSLEPEVITNDDLVRLSKVKQFCPQFHLSLQSGCDKTLKDMHRAYTTKEYYDLVCNIREIFPDSAITTDIMVGFPKETDQDFIQSMEYVKKIGFAKVHVFPYSRRSGTVADKFPQQVTKAVKRQRATKMTETAKLCQSEYLKHQVGSVYPVLFERENDDTYYHGYTPNYILVKVPKQGTNFGDSLRNSILNVKLLSYQQDYCIGQIVINS